jgi:hypothetical protein
VTRGIALAPFRVEPRLMRLVPENRVHSRLDGASQSNVRQRGFGFPDSGRRLMRAGCVCAAGRLPVR